MKLNNQTDVYCCAAHAVYFRLCIKERSALNSVAVLYSWFQKNRDLFVAGGAGLEFRDSGHGSAYVRLETASYLAELCAWDHEKCLDIQVIEIQSEKSTFPHSGRCDSSHEFEEHLDEFLTWYKREMRGNA